MSEVTRSVKVHPSYHRCDPDPHQNYGIGSATAVFTLQKDGSAIEFEVLTGWIMPLEDFRAANPDCNHPRHGGEPPSSPAMAARVMYHFNGDPGDAMDGPSDCSYTDTGTCWSDGGYAIGDPLFRLLVVEGSDAMYAEMEKMLDDRSGRMGPVLADIGRALGLDPDA